jgi:formate hydrogenlyase subunit 4
MSYAVGIGILNITLALLLSPFLEGIVRKIRAFIHSRKGPPLRQPYYDLFKLLGKENLEVSPSYLTRWAPIVCLATTLVAALLVPMGTIKPPLYAAGDVIVFIYFISFAAVIIMMSAAASESPYAQIGASREMMMVLTVEPVIVIALITGAINAHSLKMADIVMWHIANGPTVSMVIAGVSAFLAVQAQLGKLPFDIPEADQEIMGGVFVEMSGPKYALFKWGFLAKQVIFLSLFCQVFMPWPTTFILWVDVLINLVKVIIVVIVVCIIDVVNPRLRIDQAIKYFFIIIFVALMGLVFALVQA